MTPFELIESYGADTARWPADERDAALAAIAADPALQAALGRAAALDEMLAEWAARPVLAADADAVAARILRPRPVARWPRFAGAGGLIAAAVAAVIYVAPMSTAPVATPVIAAAADTGVSAQDASDFASVFTPTPEEESLI